MGRVEECLAACRRAFGTVLYTVGNHELWVRHAGAGEYDDSVQKLDALLALCERLDVRTGPTKLAGRVWVVPLLGWYEAGLDGAEVTDEMLALRERTFTDFHACVWPDFYDSDDMASVLAARNEPAVTREYDAPVITFSHFVPRHDVMADRAHLNGNVKALMDAAGSPIIDQQLRAVGSKLHIFGHTHMNWDSAIDGVHYLQNAVRYPRERTMWKSRVDKAVNGDGVLERLLVWDSEEPDFFCPQAWRCKCDAARAKRAAAASA